ncbi:hypothetical protein LZC95_44745 [Pendulispora brunnea]|uniref:Uncharacterized protein n=1 Tax=Pendulispora brunnea TaxID=2905690 RepID=A0ABZ2K9N4_9BACT
MDRRKLSAVAADVALPCGFFPLFETWSPTFRVTEIAPYMLGLQFVAVFITMILATTAHPNRQETSDGTGVSFGLVVRSTPWRATALCIAASLGAVAAILDGSGGEFSMGLESFVGRPDRVRCVLAVCGAGHATALAIALSARALVRKMA